MLLEKRSMARGFLKEGVGNTFLPWPLDRWDKVSCPLGLG